MNRYTLDGMQMTTREAAHDELARALGLPAYYGRNLDALWDEVSSIRGEILLKDAVVMLEALKTYGCKLLKLFYEADEANPDITFHIL